MAVDILAVAVPVENSVVAAPVDKLAAVAPVDTLVVAPSLVGIPAAAIVAGRLPADTAVGHIRVAQAVVDTAVAHTRVAQVVADTLVEVVDRQAAGLGPPPLVAARQEGLRARKAHSGRQLCDGCAARYLCRRVS